MRLLILRMVRRGVRSGREDVRLPFGLSSKRLSCLPRGLLIFEHLGENTRNWYTACIMSLSIPF
jgi:hypothetical protein